MVNKFLDKKALDGTVKSESISNKKLAEELRKPIFRKLKKKKKTSNLIKNLFFIMCY